LLISEEWLHLVAIGFHTGAGLVLSYAKPVHDTARYSVFT